MARAKKDGKYINIYMDAMIVKKLEVYSEVSGIPKTTIIEKALKEYLDEKEISATK